MGLKDLIKKIEDKLEHKHKTKAKSESIRKLDTGKTSGRKEEKFDVAEVEDVVTDVFFNPYQKNIIRAVAADIVDAVPVVGDVTNLVRVVKAYQEGDDKILAIQSGDLAASIVPVVGESISAIIPANTICTLIKKQEMRSKEEKVKKEKKAEIISKAPEKHEIVPPEKEAPKEETFSPKIVKSKTILL